MERGRGKSASRADGPHVRSSTNWLRRTGRKNPRSAKGKPHRVPPSSSKRLLKEQESQRSEPIRLATPRVKLFNGQPPATIAKVDGDNSQSAKTLKTRPFWGSPRARQRVWSSFSPFSRRPLATLSLRSVCTRVNQCLAYIPEAWLRVVTRFLLN